MKASSHSAVFTGNLEATTNTACNFGTMSDIFLLA